MLPSRARWLGSPGKWTCASRARCPWATDRSPPNEPWLVSRVPLPAGAKRTERKERGIRVLPAGGGSTMERRDFLGAALGGAGVAGLAMATSSHAAAQAAGASKSKLDEVLACGMVYDVVCVG